MVFTLACCQFSPAKAQLAANLDTIVERAQQASAAGVDVMVYPETAVSGYFLEGGVAECALTTDELADALTKRMAGPKIDLAIGFYERADGNLYNSMGYFEWDGASVKPVHTYRKFFLPTYGVFDEERHVSRGRGLGVFQTRFGTFGALICEDVWHSILPTLRAVAGARVMLIPSASPGRDFSGERVGNLDRYGRMLRSMCEEHGVFAANAHLCGFEGGKGFVGGSRIIDPFGKTLVESPILEDHIITAKVDLNESEVARTQLPLVSDLQSAWGDIQRLAEGL